MELWQKIVKVHDIEGTKPMDIACCIIQMRQNKLGRLRKFHDDGPVSRKKFQNFQVNIYFATGQAIDTFVNEKLLDLFVSPYVRRMVKMRM